jgi:DNA uptake protein ComE-like DNA-binding protein
MRPTNRMKTSAVCRASALIIVLWFATGLVTVALLFGYSVRMEYQIADNQHAKVESELAIEGCIEYARYILANMEEPGSFPANDSYASAYAMIGNAMVWFIGRGDEMVSLQEPVFGFVDEASKLNINTATQEMLEGLPNMTAEIAAAILDWRDEDSDLTEGGAENETYMLLRPSYPCKNALFETVEELRLVYGVEYDILYGEDYNRNGILDPNENDGDLTMPMDNQNGVLDFGLIEYVTVYSSEPNTDSDGEAKINITENNSDALSALLQETFGEERASEILVAVAGQTEITSLLQFYSVSQMTAEEFAKIDDKITVSDETVIKGLVNVNTASAVVLACIPGIDEIKAAELVTYRSSHNSSVNSMAWVTEVLDQASVIEAGPYLTGFSYQLTLDVAAVGHDGKGYSRSLLVFDLSGDEPEVRYRKDLNRLGWALGETIRTELAYAKEQKSE